MDVAKPDATPRYRAATIDGMVMTFSGPSSAPIAAAATVPGWPGQLQAVRPARSQSLCSPLPNAVNDLRADRTEVELGSGTPADEIE